MTDYIPDGLYPNTHRVSGVVTRVGELITKQSATKTFFKRELVLNVPYGSDYGTTQRRCDIIIEFRGKNTNHLTPIAAGDTVTVFFSVQGNVYNNRIYTNLVADRLEVIEKGGSRCS